MADERDPFLPLRRDVGELGRLLGETLVEQRRAPSCSSSRRRSAPSRSSAGGGREAAAAPPKGTSVRRSRRRGRPTRRTWRARSPTISSSVNLAEQHHRVRRLRARAREGAPAPGSFDHEVAALAAEVPRARLEEELARTRLTLVFTAHPSEAQRRTVLGKAPADRRAAGETRPRRADAPRGGGRRARAPRGDCPALADRRGAGAAPPRRRRGEEHAVLPRGSSSRSCHV